MMSFKDLLKRMIPSKYKDWLKKQIGSSDVIYHLEVSERKRLEGKTALVTGGSGAIGSAICFRLAMEGAFVGVGARSKEKASVVVNQIVKNGGSAIPVIMDVTDATGIKEAFCAFNEKLPGGV